MKIKLNYLLKISLLFSIVLLVSCANYGQGDRIDLNKNVQDEKSEMKAKKEMKEEPSKTDEEIAEALQAYANALKMQQVKAVMEFDINKDLKDWGVSKGADSEIKAWGGIIDANNFEGIGSKEAGDIKGWGDKGVKSIGGLDDGGQMEGIGSKEAGDIKGWGDKGVKSIGGLEGGGQMDGIGDKEAGDIKGWGSMPRSDVESIFKANAIKEILNASKSDIFGFANTKESDTKEEEEVKGYAKNKTKKEHNKSSFGFNLSSPTEAELNIAAKTAKAQLAQISALLDTGEISGYANTKCVKTKCLIKDLKKIMSDDKK